MFKIKIYCNDNGKQYWEDGEGTYETYDQALVACYENALDETQDLMANPNLLGWFEIYRAFEITEAYMNDLLKDVVFFPVATIRYDKDPWDRDFDCDIQIVTGYEIVEVTNEIDKYNKMIKNATFTSVWDGGYEVTTDCKVDMETREVFDIKVNENIDEIENLNHLDCEYITVDGEEFDVFSVDEVEDGNFWYE